MAKQSKGNNQPMVYGTHYAIGGRANLEDRVAARHIQTAGGLTLTVAMVADGMGGHNAGEVAAQLTINTVYEELEASPISTPQQIPQALGQALEFANQVVHQAARTDESKRGMGTTGTVVAVHNGCLYLAHVGDSRAYLVRNGRALQITQDHTWGREMLHRGALSPQEVAQHPKADELYSSIGYETAVHVDLGLYLEGDEPEANARKHQGEPLQPQDRLLLCSDGLVGQQQTLPKPYVSQQEIAHILERHVPDQAAKLLVKKALSRAVDDNVSVVVLELPGSKHKSIFLPRFIRTIFVFLLVAIVGVGLFLFLTQPTLFSLTPAPQPDIVIATAMPDTPTTTPTSVPVDSERDTFTFKIQANQGPFTEHQSGLPFPITAETDQKMLLYEPLGFTIFLTAQTEIEILSLAGINSEETTEIRIVHGTIVIDNQGVEPITIIETLGGNDVIISAKAIASIFFNSPTQTNDDYKFQVNCLGLFSEDATCNLQEQPISQGASRCMGGIPNCENRSYETPGAIDYEQYLQISTRIPTPTATPTVTPSPTFTSTPRPTATRPPTSTPESTATPLDPLFIESLNRVKDAISQARGVLDRFNNGQGEFECEQYEGFYDLVQRNRDATYDVSEAWVERYNDAVDIFLETSKDLYSICEADAAVTDGLNFGTARTGVDDSIEALDVIINAALNRE